MPADTVRVARPSRWGNPYKIGSTVPYGMIGAGVRGDSRDTAVALFREYVRESPDYCRAARSRLGGRNLACWCPIEDAAGNRVPCHADVLLEIANDQPSRPVLECGAPTGLDSGEPR